MLARRAIDLSKVALEFARQGYSLLPAFVPVETVRILQLSLQSVPAKRVSCGLPNVAWDEQTVGAGHLVYRFFTQTDLLREVSATVGAQSLKSTVQCWTSGYRASEYINEHTDAVGSAQLLVCLVAPPPECGGVLRFGRDGQLGQAALTPGDAILFRATHIIHSTTPLVTSPSCRDPRRLVAVARYFEE